jgi:hypothetical protein
MILANWLSRVYRDSFQGLKEPWALLVKKVMERMNGHTPLASVEYFTIPLPVSLDQSAGDTPITFATSASRPSILTGLDQGSVGEVLTVTASALSRDFNVPVVASDVTVSVQMGDAVQENVKRLVLIGASNLKKLGQYLAEEGFEIVDMCTPGWVITPESVADLEKKLQCIGPASNTAYVVDVFGNSCSRATLFDGSTTLPIKSHGGYHLPGEVGTCNGVIFGRLIDTVKPILNIVKDKISVIIPPLPRYLFRACCSDQAHCTNLGQPGHAERLLTDTVGLRAILKRRLGSALHGQYWLLDTCCTIPDSENKSVQERLTSLRQATAQDGVHLSGVGYANLAKNVTDTLVKLQSQQVRRQSVHGTAPLAVSGTRHFWRGFSSPVGSSCHTNAPSWAKVNRERNHRPRGPYERHNPRGGVHR